jgi:hypothetical protein
MDIDPGPVKVNACDPDGLSEQACHIDPERNFPGTDERIPGKRGRRLEVKIGERKTEVGEMAEKGDVHLPEIHFALQRTVGQVFHLLFEPVLEQERREGKD